MVGKGGLSLFKGFREDFTKDLALEGRLVDQVRVCQEVKPLRRVQQRMTECTKWQGKYSGLWGLEVA